MEKKQLMNDIPIHSKEDDTLNRHSSAERFAKSILATNYHQGLVVGLLGEWGAGKTSYIYLMKDELIKNTETVFEFNPWLFSDTSNLINIFFIELSTKLKIKNNDLADKFQKYGEWLSHLETIAASSFGQKIAQYLSILADCKWIGLIKPILNYLSNSLRIQGTDEYRKKITEKLEKLQKPIVVIIDDIDRLSSQEIIEIFKLVRLTANFPNIIYILAFDRIRIEQALSEQGQINGAAYLEKIIQIPFNLPKISTDLLYHQFFIELEFLLEKYTITQFNRNDWIPVFHEIIKPNLQNMRDVRRYILAIAQAINGIESSIEPVDILALEAIRLFYPQQFHEIYELKSILTTPEHHQADDIDKNRKLIKDFIQSNQQINALVQHIFPAASHYISNHYYDDSKKWKREKRVAHIYYLDLYFQHLESKELYLHNRTENIFSIMADINEFKNRLNQVPEHDIQSILNNLMTYEEQFTEEHTQIIPYLFELEPHIPERERVSFFDVIDVYWTIHTLVFSLLSSVTESNRMNVIHGLFTQTNLAGQYTILEVVFSRKKPENNLLSENDTQVLNSLLVDNILTANIQELEQSCRLIWLMDFLIENHVAIPSNFLDSESLALALIKSAETESVSQHGDEYLIRKTPRLFWDSLEKIYSSTEALNQMIEKLNMNPRFQNEPILELANKYRNGYRDKPLD